MDTYPLNARMAAEFLRRLGAHLEYNINIMDRGGVIIASRDSSRVGSFHESAYRLLSSGAEIDRVEADQALPLGVLPGVNLPIQYGGAAIGVVGVTGVPREVAPIAYAIKTSVESMVELEAYKDRALLRLDRKNLLLRYLLYEAGVTRSTVEDLASALGYDPRLPRAPVLLKLLDGKAAADSLATMKAAGIHRREDILWATPEGTILTFLALDFGGGGIIAEYEARVESYVASCVEAMGGEKERPLRAYAGSFQSDLGRYRGAYEQVQWLEERYGDEEGRVIFLSHHLGDYLASRIPRQDFVAAFDSFLDLLPADVVGVLPRTIRALEASAYNGSLAAALLGVHRNTLSARLSHLSSVLGTDLREDHGAREFCSVLVRYLELRGLPRQP